MNRRSFLAAMLAACAAPAIVRADSLMRVFVPKPVPLVTGYEFGSGDFTIELWVAPGGNGLNPVWRHVAQTRENGVFVDYLDGVRSAPGSAALACRDLQPQFTASQLSFNPNFTGLVSDLRITKDLARNVVVGPQLKYGFTPFNFG